MGLVGFLGILLSLAALPFSSVRLTSGRILLFGALLIVHIATTVTFYLYAQTNPSDTTLYYFDDMGMRYESFQFGTIFTVKFVQFLREMMGGSNLDYFFLFQTTGFWGIVVLMRVFDEIRIETGNSRPVLYGALLFLPGIHFWTSAIGKDGFLFFAASMAIWSLMKIRRRFAFFALSITVMVLFRPHIALIAVVALAIAAFFNRRFGLLTKGSLLAVALIGAAIVAMTIESTFRVSVTNAESISEFIASKNETFETIEGNTAVHGAGFPFKLFSLLFRPLFLDAEGIFALVASIENLILLLIIAFILIRWRSRNGLEHLNLALKFAFSFAALTAIALALVYYNVGLGLRQKTMIMPALLVLFVARTSAFRVRLPVRPATVQEPTPRQAKATA